MPRQWREFPGEPKKLFRDVGRIYHAEIQSRPPANATIGQSRNLLRLERSKANLLNVYHPRRFQPGSRRLAVKDNFCTKDFPTTCASGILQGFNSPGDAQTVRLLRDELIVAAKTNMDEFGMGSHSVHSYNGPVQQEIHGRRRSAGGSSGGSAMAVAMSQSSAALGTDTGGSVRLPAAYTTTVGFKPSYGLLSRDGVVPYANSLDTVGLIGASCGGVARAFRLLNQHDPNDPTSLSDGTRHRIEQTSSKKLEDIFNEDVERLPQTADGVPAKPRACRIGVPVEYNIKELSRSVHYAWVRTLSFLESQGHEIVSISLPATKQALSAYYVIAPAEASSNLAKYDGVRYGVRSSHDSDTEGGTLFASTRGAHFGPEVRRRILLGTYTLSSAAMDNYFIQAQKVRRLVQQDFDRVFRMQNPLHDGPPADKTGVDFIVCPTAPSPPPSLEAVLAQKNPLEAYMNDVFTVPASLAGLPAISVPLPPEVNASTSITSYVGMQVIGQFGDDASVLCFAARHLRSPGQKGLMNRRQKRPKTALIR